MASNEALIGGAYAPHACLQRDSYGEVWLAHDAENRAVHLRIVPSEIEITAPARATLRSLVDNPIVHPALVEPFAFGTMEDGRNYLVADRVEGETLAQLLAREGRLQSHVALRIAADLADALRVLHERGACHGRLDPTRILVARNDETDSITVRLTDVALGVLVGDECSEERSTRPRIDLEVGFLSPELAAGEGPATPECDIWALGAILSRCVVGENPFEARSRARLIVETALRTVRPQNVDEDLADLIENCLAREPILRPAAAEVLTTIQAIQQRHGSTSESPAIPPKPTTRPSLLAVAGGVGALLAVMLVLPIRGKAPPTPTPLAHDLEAIAAHALAPAPTPVEPTPAPTIAAMPSEQPPTPAPPKPAPKKKPRKSEPDPFYGVTKPGF